MKKILLIIFMILAFIALNNCNAGTELADEIAAINNGDEYNNTGKSGKIKLVLDSDKSCSISGIASAAKEDVLSLIITIDGLKVHKTSGEDAGWHTLPVEEGSYDLMLLDQTSWAELLSLTEITPGTYNNLRFVVESAEVTTASGTYTATVSSGKIQVNLSFTVTEEMVVEITLTIDPKKSLKVTGNKNNPKYKLSPVFKLGGISEEED